MKRINMLGLACVAALVFWAAGPVLATTHTWTQTAGGAQSWEVNGNWSGGAWPTPASGDTVDFSTVTFTTNTTLTLGADRTAEVWKFGDTGSAQDWTIAASNKIILAGTTPTIDVVNRTATLLNGLDGSAGLTKTGSGTLTICSTNNSYSGATTVSQGTLKLTVSLAPVSGAVLWLDAAAGSSVMTSGGTITNWSSLGSYGGSVTTDVGAPTYVPGGLNGLPVARFNNASYLSNSGLLTGGNFPNNQATVFIVYAPNSDGDYGLAWTGVNYGEYWRYSGNGQPYMGMFRQSRVEGGVVVPNTGAHLLTLTANKPGNSYVMTVDGGTNVNTTFAPNFAFGTAFRLGWTDGGGYLNGDIAEVLIYNTALSAADQATVNTYLNAKWFGAGVGTPAALPSSTALSIASGSTFDLNGASAGQTVASLSDSGVVTNSAAYKSTLTINPSSGSTTFSGAIGGPINLVKSGIATQILTGASTHTGGTTVSSGTLLVNGSISGAVSVASAGTLGGTGAIMGNVAFATGGSALFTHGAPLTFTGPVTLNNNTVHLALPDSLADGTYLLATNTTGNFSGAFALTPVIDSGSTLSTNRMISTDASAVRLLVSSADIFPPTPDPMTFAVKPAALSSSSVVMTATTAIEGMNPPVEYFFTNTVNGATSGWNTDTVWTNTGLTAGTIYGYRVKARDQLGNTTAWSVEADIVTLWTATSLYWDGGTADIAGNGNGASLGGDGTWNTTIRNWDLGSAYPHVAWDNSNNDTAVFSGTAGTVTLGTVAAGSVTFTNFTGTYTLTGGSLTNSGGITVAANAGAVTISTPIGGSGGIVKNGSSSTLTLSGANTYTNSTVINAGNLTINNNSALGSGPVTVNNGGTLGLGNVVLNKNLTLNGGTLALGGGNGAGGFSGTITLAANSNIYVDGSNFNTMTISAAISGAGGYTQNGPGRAGATLLTNASNIYNGPTVINNGALIVKSSLYDNDTSKWTPSNITVAANAVFGLSVGGVGEFTMAQAATMFTNLTTAVNNNGMRPNSFMSLDTRNASAGTYTFSGVLADSTGTGGGAVNFEFNGTSTTTLELTGSNTYSGVTMTRNNGTLKVSSFNSVNGGNPPMASSSLGRPITIAKGTIMLGESNWNANTMPGTTYASGNLTYTGTGETTDRVIFLGGYSGTRNYTLDQSGTGLLKFTSNFDQQIANTHHNLILAGSTTGTGEIAGTIIQAYNGGLAWYTNVKKNGTGTWTLSGANTYAGVTEVNQGALLITGSISNGAVSVASGAMLGGGGTIGGNVTYASGAKALFTPGQTLKIKGSLILNNNVVNVNVPANFSGGTFTLATYTTTGSSGTFATAPVAINGTLSPAATITTANGTVTLYVPPTGTLISFF